MTRCNNCNELYPVNDTGRMTPRHLAGFCPGCQQSIKRALESRPKQYQKMYLPPIFDEDNASAEEAYSGFKNRPDFKEFPQGYLGTQTESDVMEEFFYSDEEYSLLMVKSTGKELLLVAYEWDTNTRLITGYWMSCKRDFPRLPTAVKMGQEAIKKFYKENNIP